MADINLNPTDSKQVQNYDKGMDIVNTYEFHPGTCILPLAEDPPTNPEELKNWSPVVELQLHAPYRVRKVKYDTLKCNNPPIMPAPVSTGAFIFTGGAAMIQNTLNASNSVFDWHVSTVYSYVENCVSRPQDGLVLGSPPWIWGSTITAAQAAVTPSQSELFGAVSYAGGQVLKAKGIADSIGFDISGSQQTYLCTIPSFYPGNFFNWFLVNGGIPTATVPSQG